MKVEDGVDGVFFGTPCTCFWTIIPGKVDQVLDHSMSCQRVFPVYNYSWSVNMFHSRKIEAGWLKNGVYQTQVHFAHIPKICRKTFVCCWVYTLLDGYGLISSVLAFVFQRPVDGNGVRQLCLFVLLGDRFITGGGCFTIFPPANSFNATFSMLLSLHNHSSKQFKAILLQSLLSDPQGTDLEAFSFSTSFFSFVPPSFFFFFFYFFPLVRSVPGHRFLVPGDMFLDAIASSSS